MASSTERSDTERRFAAKYIPEPMSGCWLWEASVVRNGEYGSFWFDGKLQSAHRASYQLYRGEIPVGGWVLHSCDTPLCVNPDHLFLGDHAVNMRDAARKGRLSTKNHRNKRKTHCAEGHPYSGKNLKLYGPTGTWRKCRQCIRDKELARYHLCRDRQSYGGGR